MADTHDAHQSARLHRSAYFEKLALLDGGIVGLCVTAVLGPFRSQIEHRYLLGVGLSSLVLAMLVLILRNYHAANVELYAAARRYEPNEASRLENVHRAKEWSTSVAYLEQVGLSLSWFGILLLLAQIWFLIVKG